MINEAIATRIVKLIASDISDRSGLGDMWGSIDDETRAEIISEWRELIIKECAHWLLNHADSPKCICPEHAHDEACKVCIAGSGNTEFYDGIEWFACWLLDHAEGETITEEQLRPWAVSAYQGYLAKKERKQ